MDIVYDASVQLIKSLFYNIIELFDNIIESGARAAHWKNSMVLKVGRWEDRRFGVKASNIIFKDLFVLCGTTNVQIGSVHLGPLFEVKLEIE